MNATEKRQIKRENEGHPFGIFAQILVSFVWGTL